MNKIVVVVEIFGIHLELFTLFTIEIIETKINTKSQIVLTFFLTHYTKNKKMLFFLLFLTVKLASTTCINCG